MVSVNNTTQPATILKVFLAEANSDFFNKTSKNLVHCVLNAYIAHFSVNHKETPWKKTKKQSLSSNTDPKPDQSQPHLLL